MANDLCPLVFSYALTILCLSSFSTLIFWLHMLLTKGSE